MNQPDQLTSNTMSEAPELDTAELVDENALTEAVVEDNAFDESDAESTAGQAKLIVKRNGAETEDIFDIFPPAMIGRFDAAVGPIDVDLGPLPEGVYVSRKHAKIICEDGVWKLVDLGSSNGTFILRDDFERVEEAELKDGDEFALGNARFIFRLS